MSAKISAARRAAFLKALGATGNVTVSAERAKVSRSWVLLHRKADAGFDAACREALAATVARLDGHGARRPPTGWGTLDGVELVVRGSGGSVFAEVSAAAGPDARPGRRRVQIARARLRQWTPRVEDRFLATLAATCNVKAACAEVGMWPPSAYNHRIRWPAFARRWDEAIENGYARIELALLQSAGNPFSSPDTELGAPMGEMTAMQAIHLLHMHKHQVKGIGWRPGRRGRDPTMEEVRESVMRKIEVIERGERLSEAVKAKDAAERARRRGAG